MLAASELERAEDAFERMAKLNEAQEGVKPLTVDETLLIREIEILYRTREGIAIEPGADTYPEDVDELNAMDGEA